MSQKRPLFLLEILIALSLVTLCIAPLMKGPMDRHHAEMETLTRIEKSRVAAWTFTEIVEKLLKHEIRWEALPKLGETGSWTALADVPLKLPPLPEKSTLTRKFALHTLKEKQETDGKIHRLLAIHLKIGPTEREFTYRVTVSKLPASL